MKTAIIIFLLCAAGFMPAQISEDYVFISGTDTNNIAFMYAGNDTLEYASKNTPIIKVIIDTIINKKSQELFFMGRMLDAQTGESLGDNGLIILGSLEYKRKFWLGKGRKGIIKRKEAEYKTEGGRFSIYINSEKFPESFLFTAPGYGVVDIGADVFTYQYLQYQFKKSFEGTRNQRGRKTD